jgi:hypothetical protein
VRLTTSEDSLLHQKYIFSSLWFTLTTSVSILRPTPAVFCRRLCRRGGGGGRGILVGGGMLDVLLLKFFFRLRLAEAVQQNVACCQSYAASARLVIFTGSMRRGQINGLAVRRWGASFSILLSRHLESVLSKRRKVYKIDKGNAVTCRLRSVAPFLLFIS